MKDCIKVKLCCKIPASVYKLIVDYSDEHYLSLNDTVSFLLINCLKEDVYFKHFYFQTFNSFNSPDLVKAISFLSLINRLKKIKDVENELKDNF